MASTTFRNVINGELVDAASGETYDVVDPTTGEVYATAPTSGAEDVDRAYQAAATAFETWGETTPSERQLAMLKIADAMEKRSREFVDVESRDTGKPIGFTIDEEMPPAIDQIRFFAGAARVLEGKSAGEYLKRPHLVRPPRADRRGRPGHPVELPADDDGVEDRARAGGRQHASCSSPATPRRPPRRCSPSWPRSSCRPACSTSSAATATPAARWSSTRSRSWSRSPARCGPACRSPSPAPTSSSGSTSSSAARRRSWSSTTPTSRRPPRASPAPGYFNAGQDCTAATRVHRRPGRSTTSSSRR